MIDSRHPVRYCRWSPKCRMTKSRAVEKRSRDEVCQKWDNNESDEDSQGGEVLRNQEVDERAECHDEPLCKRIVL
jgi:hypothetical protein